MIKLVFCLHRQPHLTEDEFRSYWRVHHAELVASVADILGIRRYVQLDPQAGPAASALSASRGQAMTFDGIAELWFDDEEALMRSTDTPEGREAARSLLEDEKRFIDLSRSPIWLYQEHPILGA
jgi:uncharacterized protein (TIGR02118 family)